MQAAPPACIGGIQILGALLESNDTVYTCVGIPLTFDDVSLLDGILSSRDWVFGDGDQQLNSLVSTQANHAYNQEGTYTVTLTVASLLCAEITIPRTVIVLGNPTFDVSTSEIDCNGNCNGELTMNVQSANSNLYNVFWDVTGALGNTVSDLCPGDYNAILGDQLGCTDLQSGPYTLVDPDLLMASIDLADTIGLCPSSGITNVSMSIVGGIGGYQAIWEASTAISQVNAGLMQFTPTQQSLDRMYPVIVQDGNGCTTSDSIFIRSTPTLLGGTVYVGANPCKNCQVIQLHHDTDPGLWHEMASTTTDNDGNYDFGVIANFLPFTIMAIPDQQLHPNAPSGFYPNGHLWTTAFVIQNVCGLSLNKHIDILEPMNFNGSNTFSGIVYYDPTGKTQTEEDPIPLIDVVVEKTPPGQAQGMVGTNNDGEYSFNFVPNSDTLYTIYVSMPGIPVVSTYEILADAGNEDYQDLNFCLNIDSTEINICNQELSLVTGNSVESSEESFILYPNPTNGRFTIETGKFAETNSELRIVDAVGRVVFQKHYAETPYTINMVNIAEGYYFVQLMNETDSDASPISVMRY